MNLEENVIAKKLHDWYLEATAKLKPESFNHNAKKSYDDLTDEQKFIDIYIAKKVVSFISQATREEDLREIEKKVCEVYYDGIIRQDGVLWKDIREYYRTKIGG